MERKEFLQFAGAFCGVTIMGGLLTACSKNDSGSTAAPSANFTVDLSASSNAALTNVGGHITQNNINIVHTSSGYVAFSAICTHQGCTVGYNGSSNEFVCPCHGGVYSITGAVVSGPPPSALKQYTVNQNGNVLTIT
ncbi:ubiquinol-cytochrome c reductase iron-sulfur subunit [Chitinophagaceae bacterium MMS25-I14]